MWNVGLFPSADGSISQPVMTGQTSKIDVWHPSESVMFPSHGRGPRELGKAPLQALILWQGLPGQAIVQASLPHVTTSQWGTGRMQFGEIEPTHMRVLTRVLMGTVILSISILSISVQLRYDDTIWYVGVPQNSGITGIAQHTLQLSVE